jgi:hypothetical protein
MSDPRQEPHNTDRSPDGAETASTEGDDPRPVSDGRLREEMSREEVEAYREDADKAHANWFSVMNNPYGKD